MKKIILNKNQLLFLLEKVTDQTFQQKLRKHLNNGTNFIIQLSDEDSHRLVQILADLLCTIGMQNDNELNSTGLFIEELINLFNPY